MARDLPYFKFFCSEWNDGDITFEDYDTQGIFINVCSWYWSKECDLDFNKLYKRFKGYETQLDNLLASELIYNCDGKLCINFLDEQLKEREKLSKQNSVNAKKRWGKDATAQSSQSDNDAIKKREEKRIEEKIDNLNFVFQLVKDNAWVESVAMKNKISLELVKEKLSIFENHLITIKKQHQNKKEFVSHFLNWLNISKTKTKKQKLTF